MSEPVKLRVVGIPKKVDRQTVELAEEILKRAKAGELQDLAFTATTHDGQVHTGFTPTSDQIRQLAAVARLLHRLQLAVDDTTYDPKPPGDEEGAT